jgi:hypothetical protein
MNANVRHATSFLAAVMLLVGAMLATPADAHKPSDAYLTLQREGQSLHGQWDIALRDLDAAIGLDGNGDGEITWGEVHARQDEIAAYAMPRLQIRSGGQPCPVRASRQLAEHHTDGAYVVLMIDGACAADAPTLQVHYSLLFDIDPQHRGLLQYIERGAIHSVIFASDEPQQIVGGDAGGPARQWLAYAHEGVWHIWLGFDHILFLLSLLLPAVLVRRDDTWHAAPSFRQSFMDVAKVVTAFTVAHSITLSLAALGVVALPSRWVESAIALSVVLAALNNLRPMVGSSRWMAAFAFGLVHGFGFAGALQDLGLPRGSLALSLFGFNVGVEAGQLVLVAVFLPAAFAVRATMLYRRVALVAGSGVIAAIAAVWLVERAFDVPVFAAIASS